MQKVKGYTLIDVLFAMAFIITVIAMATMAYSYLMKHSLSMTQSKSKVLNQGKMSFQIRKDLWQADSVRVTPEGFSLYRDTTEIIYQIEAPEQLTRTQHSRIDTLDIHLLHIQEEDGTLSIDYEQLGAEFNLTVKTNDDLADKINQNMIQLGDQSF